jgi:hypothetical protein
VLAAAIAHYVVRLLVNHRRETVLFEATFALSPLLTVPQAIYNMLLHRHEHSCAAEEGLFTAWD